MLNFKMVMNWKKIHIDCSLFNLLVKRGLSGKIKYKFYFFMGRKTFFFIFSFEEKHFLELWIVVSYFVLEPIIVCYSAKLGVLQKAILRFNSSKLLVKTFQKYLWNMFLWLSRRCKTRNVIKKDFLQNYISRIKTLGVEQLC